MSERDMQQLLELVERHLGASWSQIVDWLRDNNSLAEIERRLEAKDIEGVVAELDAAAEQYSDAVHAGYLEAGEQQTAWLGGELDKVIRFDQENTRAARWAKDNELQLKEGVTEDSKATVKDIIADGVQRGINPREMARDIRDSIGLTSQRAAAVNSYRRALEDRQYAEALSRQLSDGRSDRAIQAAQRAGRDLTQDQIDVAVERYRQNQITSRATAIARTDGLRAVHAGSRDALKEAVAGGHVEADALERSWHHTNAGKYPREDHEAMDGQVRGLDDPFTSGSGAELMYPGDPDADPEETVNCRCVASTRLVA